MKTPPTTPSTLKKLNARLSRLSDETVDLFEKDLENGFRSAVHSHGKRVWERMNARERDAVRKEVAAQNSVLSGDSDDHFLDILCVDAIEKQLKASGKFRRRPTAKAR